jgi:N-dimethylarginine dimethylaminohydrolase
MKEKFDTKYSFASDLDLRGSFCVCVMLGREIFVGLNDRTNVLGAQAVAKAFPEYPTTTVHVDKQYVHLKDYVTLAGPEVLVISKSEAARRTFKVNCYRICLFKRTLFTDFC